MEEKVVEKKIKYSEMSEEKKHILLEIDKQIELLLQKYAKPEKLVARSRRR